MKVRHLYGNQLCEIGPHIQSKTKLGLGFGRVHKNPSSRWEVALTPSERQIGASVLGFALVSVIMKGMETNNKQKDRQWIL